MKSSRVIIAVSFLFATALIPTSGRPASSTVREAGRAYGRSGRPKHDADYENWLGWRLYHCLWGNRTCSFFIGTLEEVVGPPEDQAKSEDPRSLRYSKVSVRVDMWLYGDQQGRTSNLTLDNVPVVKGLMYGSEFPGSRWRDVTLKPGNRLLVAFYPPKEKTRRALDKIDEYGLVVADENLFPAIIDVLEINQRYQKDPNDIINAPETLGARKDDIFAAYLVAFFRLNVKRPDPEIEANVLIRLMGSSLINENAWHLLTLPLIGAMSDQDHPVSEVTKKRVTEALVVDGGSDYPALADAALMALVPLTDGGRIDMKQFLSADRRRRLISNYQRARLEMFGDKQNPGFESQLR